MSPAWIKDKETIYFSFLRSRRPPHLHRCRKVPQGSEKGGALTTIYPGNFPETLVLESILAKRCTYTEGRDLRQVKLRLKTR